MQATYCTDINAVFVSFAAPVLVLVGVAVLVVAALSARKQCVVAYVISLGRASAHVGSSRRGRRRRGNRSLNGACMSSERSVEWR